ncbi:hypothetical protein CEJ63_22715, partial [Acinetobacter baumannii]
QAQALNRSGTILTEEDLVRKRTTANHVVDQLLAPRFAQTVVTSYMSDSLNKAELNHFLAQQALTSQKTHLNHKCTRWFK